ncbi:MAG TPA: GerMN domain-containing protein [Vicinamibacterales bacterium]|jgi:spore germination protein GerM
MPRQILAALLFGATILVVAVLFFVAFPRRYATPRVEPAAAAAPATPAATTPAPAGRKIKAHLYYVGENGTTLTSVERDVAYGDGNLAQAREIVLAQIASVSDPTVSAVPQGTTLRALFLTEKGEAFVDLSREFASAHTGGTSDELLTVYSIVNALTTNLPAITEVQILVDGKEVDTLAGHLDLRRPLAKNLDYVQ